MFLLDYDGDMEVKCGIKHVTKTHPYLWPHIRLFKEIYYGGVYYFVNFIYICQSMAIFFVNTLFLFLI